MKTEKLKVNWKQFGYESEIEYHNCTKHCDYVNNNIAINDKRPACYNVLNCIIYRYTEMLKLRIKIEKGECSPVTYCGKDGCEFDFGINEDMEDLRYSKNSK